MNARPSESETLLTPSEVAALFRVDLRRRQQSLGLARSGVHVVLPSMSAARAGGMRQCHTPISLS